MEDNFDEFLQSLTLEEKLQIRERVVMAIYEQLCEQADEEYRRQQNARLN